MRSLVGPHDGESDEEGEDLNDGATRDGQERGVRGNGIAVEDEVRVAHVVEKTTEDVGKDDEPVLRERRRNRHTQVWRKVWQKPVQRTVRKVKKSTKLTWTGSRME